MTSQNISSICPRQKSRNKKCRRLPRMPTIGALHTLNGEDLRGSRHMIKPYDQGHDPVSKKLTPSAFLGALPLDNEHLQEKDHSHEQQNSIDVQPPCKQVYKIGQADELSAIVDTDPLSHLVLSCKGPYRQLETSNY